MTGSNLPARRGFLASLSGILGPQPIREDLDENAPLTPPKGVLTASVLAIIAGLLFLFQGVLGLTQIDATVSNAVQSYQQQYNQQVSDCAQVGGIGTAVTATTPDDLVSTCKGLTSMTDRDWADLTTSYHSSLTVLLVVFIVFGLGSAVGGWFLRSGAAWSRRVIVAITVVTVLGALMLHVFTVLTLPATVAMLIAMVLCYISSGGQFFYLVKQRKRRA